MWSEVVVGVLDIIFWLYFVKIQILWAPPTYFGLAPPKPVGGGILGA
jgi:hypothetical protein